MSPKIVLSYFDYPALGEPLRLALAMTGQPWEDKRVSKEEFMAMKPSEYSSTEHTAVQSFSLGWLYGSSLRVSTAV